MKNHLKFMIMALAISASVQAQQIMLTSSNVIGGSLTIYSGTWNSGVYSALGVVDAQTGTVSDNNTTPTGGPYNYWLSPQAATGVNAYFVINLGAPYLLSQVDLFNTRNAAVGDRSTANFSMLASNSITANVATGGYDLGGTPVTILTGTLTAVADYNAITAATFTTSSSTVLTNVGVAYQYLQFTAGSFLGT